jgi:hypothetical protein
MVQGDKVILMRGPMTCLPSLHISLLTSEMYLRLRFTNNSESETEFLCLHFFCFVLLDSNELPPPLASPILHFVHCFSAVIFLLQHLVRMLY